MLDFFICASTNLLRMYLIYRFVMTFLDRYEGSKGKEILSYVCFYIINTVLFWELHIAWVNVVCNFLGISMVVCFHTKSIKTNLFVTSAIYLITFACDAAVTLPFIYYQDGQSFSQIYAAISVFLFFICELLTEKVVTIHKNTETPQDLPLIFVPICSVVAICLLLYMESFSGIGVAIVSICLLVVNFLMLYLYNYLLHSMAQKYETEMLRQKVQVYSEQLGVILQNEERIKALRHDMKHHLNELILLANKYKVAEIQEYIGQMEEFVRNPKEIISSGNIEIDSILNYMLQKAYRELETVNVKVVLPEKLQHSFDINVILGNLLENAIEAAEKTDEKRLDVNIQMQQGILRIQIENSYNGKPEEKNHRLLTTKEEKELHGIGLRNVRKMVEKYNGIMEVCPHQDMFCVGLILYMS
ncbi:MAG: GHKL domain-containing protein [Lachnospiraceae bacterium]|nr:GHKL domain-containing protein [Lachnospiraceae bacterium]